MQDHNNWQKESPLQGYQRRLWEITSTLPDIHPDGHLDATRPDIAAVHSACALGLQVVVTNRTKRISKKSLADILLTLPGIERGAPLDMSRVDVKAVLDAYELGFQELLRELRSGEIYALPGAQPEER
jgi:hypothetical protein